MIFEKKLLAFWGRKSLLAHSLQPLSWVFQLLITLRRSYYQMKGPIQFPVPIIVVGNITVGGTGKTPLVAYLVQLLQNQGLHPGIVMRGFKGNYKEKVCAVTMNSDVATVGDEALLLALKTKCPIVVGKNRPQAVAYLLAQNPHVNIVISDDGLQHYALSRDIEIIVIDANKPLGNGFCLPVGPLRESAKRLQTVDYVITHGDHAAQWPMLSSLSQYVYALDPTFSPKALTDFQNKTVHAVAAIGDPKRFFNQLKAQGIHVIEHAFSDHHAFKIADFNFKKSYPLLMTEKDAVKCKQLGLNNAWVVPLDVTLSASFEHHLLRRIFHGQKITRDLSLSHL